MRIVALEAQVVEIGLAEPYTIAYETVDRVANVFVRLVTDGRLTGVGCAAPDASVTGETTASVVEALEGEIGDRLRGADPWRWMRHLEELRAALPAAPSARAAIDMALLDLVAKQAELPLWQLLGGYREAIPTSITIGILDEEATTRAARERVAEGFRCLKLKGGADVDDDIARVRKVREAVGDDIELRFDANQGYSYEDSLRFVEETRAARLEMLEQPTDRSRLKLLGRVTEAVHLPVMADESLMTLRDAFRLAGDELVDMINIKLMKVGGINEAIRITAISRAAGMEVMVGCMDEAALAIAAGLAFALARPGVTYADLDGHLDLVDDPTAGAVVLADGLLHPTGRPGLGFDLEL